VELVAGVAGASGEAGGELLRLVAGHPHLRLGAITANSQVGQPVSEVHPALAGRPGLADRVFDSPDGSDLGDSDLVFVALPRGEAAVMAGKLPASIRVVDLGPDHRLTDGSVWARTYGGPYAGSWPYALPELPGARARIGASSRLATPSCYATAVLLGSAPLVRAGIAGADDAVVTVLAGSSSAGRTGRSTQAKGGHLGSVISAAMRGYQVGGEHGSIPEIEQELTALTDRQARLSLVPVLAPTPRGILAICSLPLTRETTTEELRKLLTQMYLDEPFVRLMREGRWPATSACIGTNIALLQVAADPHADRCVVMCAIDNLGKGAAGQAVQGANLMFGLPEIAGLQA